MRERERPALARRGLLSSIAALPLIGGSAALTSHPTVAAVHVPEGLKLRYLAFLANEHANILREINPLQSCALEVDPSTDWHLLRLQTPLFWFPEAPDVEAVVTAVPASTRAEAVLKAVGVSLG